MTHTASTKKTRNFSIKDDVFGSLPGLVTVAIVLIAISFFVGGWMLFAQSTNSTPAPTGTHELMVADRGDHVVVCVKGDLICPEDAVPAKEYFQGPKQGLSTPLADNHRENLVP